MNVRYTVASCVDGEFVVVADVAGTPTEVKVPGLIVELISEDGSMGHTLRLRGRRDELNAAGHTSQIGAAIAAAYTAI